MMINLTDQQTNAANAITLWHRNRSKPYFFLAGFAGTGKTTITYVVITSPSYLNLPITPIDEYRANEKAYRNQPKPDKDDNPDAKRFPPPSYNTAFAAFTAKAAQVMQSKGIPASTIHSLLYQPIVNQALIEELTLQLSFINKTTHPETHNDLSTQLKEAKQPKFSYVPPADSRSRLRNTKLIVLDECSMIGDILWQDLLRTQIPILILGDTNQLPPVKDQQAPFSLQSPDFQLTEIMRQSAQSPIINFATCARTQSLISFGRILHPDHSKLKPQLASRIPLKQFQAQHLTRNDLLWFDQIICATHRRRHYLNRLYRQLSLNTSSQSLPTFPQIGEKIICGENDHELQLYNGSLYIVTDIDQASYQTALDSFIPTVDPQNPSLPAHPITFTQKDLHDPFGSSQDPSSFKQQKPTTISFELTQTDPNSINNELDRSTSTWVTSPIDTFLGYNDTNFIPSNDFVFDFGYAITVHKSQGSQWPKVLVWNERMHQSQTHEDYAKWLYTAITRASDCVVLAG